MRKLRVLCSLTALLGAGAAPASAADLAGGFAHPPDSARPWVYWFPLNGNLSSNGITADLEAMKRVGIGGVLYMETDQGAPAGPAGFAGPLWRDLVKHICSEAHRLGLEVNMNNDAGWCGSGGPWITPELSMQQVVSSATNVSGPLHFAGMLPQPPAKMNLLSRHRCARVPHAQNQLPDTEHPRQSQPKIRGRFRCNPFCNRCPRRPPFRAAAWWNSLPTLEVDGSLVWDVPPGQWTILRLGHTTTGVENHPAPAGGLGLESDKLSQEASDAAFAGLMAKVIADSKPLAGKGKTLVSTHIDSWETGSQNWTPRFREEFQAFARLRPAVVAAGDDRTGGG